LLLHLARPKIKIVSTGDIGVFGELSTSPSVGYGLENPI